MNVVWLLLVLLTIAAIIGAVFYLLWLIEHGHHRDDRNKW